MAMCRAAAMLMFVPVVALAAEPPRGDPPDGAAARAAEKVYDELFGKAERGALATPDKGDDRDLATQLLRHGVELRGTAAEDVAARLLLLERAYLLTAHDAAPAGVDTATRALNALADADPNNRAYWLARLGDVSERAQRRALAGGPGVDRARQAAAAQASLKQLAADGQAAWAGRQYLRAAVAYRKAAALARRLRSADPSPEELERLSGVASARVLKQDEARRLQAQLGDKATPQAEAAASVRVLLLLVDDADQAARVVAGAEDAVLAQIVALAGRDPSQLSADEARRLGDWYWSYRDAREYDGGRPVIAARVAACLERRMELTADPTERSRIEAGLKSVRRLAATASDTRVKQ